MAFLDFARGNYYSRIWFLGGPSDSTDVLMTMMRKLPDGLWQLKYRFRTKNDNGVFDSSDDKSFWSATFPTTLTEAEVVEKVSPLLQQLVDVTGLPVDATMIESDEPAVIIELMRGKPFFHMQFEKVKS